ncbi:glutathione S-transferase family protein [Sneathiella glossodoripedis]|uniref:glutathione S-transferase family protein n=1 Tax=Sneathiella glossodoripedis TaxID=418853 RepID=UPI0004714299|nr:glutathione S-transferase family protein [Sneathiella glossodoripedis]
MKLFFRPLACSLACRIAAIEGKLDLDFVEVELFGTKLANSDQSFLEISDKGKVATLQLENGVLLTENAAILQYLADASLQRNLAPAPDSELRYRLQEALSFVGSELHKGILYPLFQQDTPEQTKAHVRLKAPRILDQLDGMLNDRDWILGADFSVADCYLIWAIYLLKLSGFELSQNIKDYYKRAKARPSVQQAMEIELSLYQEQMKAA